MFPNAVPYVPDYFHHGNSQETARDSKQNKPSRDTFSRIGRKVDG